MPPLYSEVLGVIAVVVLLLALALLVDPTLRATRKRNRAKRVLRHAAQGCEPCRIRVARAATSPESFAPYSSNGGTR